MSIKVRSQQEILAKLKIAQLNPMQEEAKKAISRAANTILLSPTGTGKTLAFLLPIVGAMDPDVVGIQTLILAPSRELAIQIEQVAREMGSGYKVNVAYGGRSIAKDRIELETPPSILIGTPGRIADHIRRETFDVSAIHTVVLDEFDKSLEIGFEEDMRDILEDVSHANRRVLTSATQDIAIPRWVEMRQPLIIDYLDQANDKLEVRAIISPDKDKLDTLVAALHHLGSAPGIVFCNFRDSIDRISDHLHDHGISHGCFYGGMEQKDRERALIKFRNGTHQLLLATDLAARGIDVSEIKFIIHYHLPQRATEFTHRNGRTARMNKEGIAYVLRWSQEVLPDFISEMVTEEINPTSKLVTSPWKTLFISGGRKDKISKGDVAGLFFKQGLLEKGQLGIIELKHDCAFAAVRHDDINAVIGRVTDKKIKKRKVRVSLI